MQETINEELQEAIDELEDELEELHHQAAEFAAAETGGPGVDILAKGQSETARNLGFQSDAEMCGWIHAKTGGDC